MKRQIEQTIARLQLACEKLEQAEYLPVARVIHLAFCWIRNGAYSYYETQAHDILKDLRRWEQILMRGNYHANRTI